MFTEFPSWIILSGLTVNLVMFYWDNDIQCRKSYCNANYTENHVCLNGTCMLMNTIW
jgi:hypothetical protein